MNRVQSGGGMPPMEELMQDPNLRNLYEKYLLVQPEKLFIHLFYRANQFGGAGAGPRN